MDGWKVRKFKMLQVVAANGEEEFDGLPADHEYEVTVQRAILARYLDRCIWYFEGILREVIVEKN